MALLMPQSGRSRHRDNKFGWIFECDPGWDGCATGLQVTPLQRAVDAVEDENNALL